MKYLHENKKSYIHIYIIIMFFTRYSSQLRMKIFT